MKSMSSGCGAPAFFDAPSAAANSAVATTCGIVGSDGPAAARVVVVAVGIVVLATLGTVVVVTTGAVVVVLGTAVVAVVGVVVVEVVVAAPDDGDVSGLGMPGVGTCPDPPSASGNAAVPSLLGS